MKKIILIVSFIACLIACAGDFIATYYFGSYYPGYNHLIQPMSALGASGSPVSAWMSGWWIIMGILFIFVGIAIRITYSSAGKAFRIASWMMMLYGAGEGIGSGLFPANHIHNHLTLSGLLHNIIGGVGVIALLSMPIVLIYYYTKDKYPFMYWFSICITITGLLTFLLFTLSKVVPYWDTILIYRGLWQRLFVLIYYIYLVTLSYKMIRYKKT
jgi:hypothetical protein